MGEHGGGGKGTEKKDSHMTHGSRISCPHMTERPPAAPPSAST